MDKKVLNEMFENLLHIGNKTNFWSPKMKENIYGSVNGIHVFNLIKTNKHLEDVKSQLKELATQGKKILFVATKLQARDAFAELATSTGHYYVTEKWVPGLLTNFKTIRRRISTYLRLLKEADSGAMDILTKKEKAAKMLELEKLDRAFKGLKEMKRLPDVIFAVDGVFEKQALKEASSLKLTSFAILNTNGDPDSVDGYIPANTNAVKSLEYIAKQLTSVLTGIKVVPRAGNKVNKIEQKKSSFKKTAPVKAPAKKQEDKTEAKVEEKTETKKTVAKKAPAKKTVAKKPATKTIAKKEEK